MSSLQSAGYPAIFFDFDGVLVDSEPVHYDCWREILDGYGLDLDWKTYSEHGIGTSDRSLLAHVCRQTNPPFDVELLAAQYPRKKEMFRLRMLENPPFSNEVLELLRELQNYPLAVVTTSGLSEVEPILVHAGARDFFRAAVYGGDVKRHKPAPDPYLLAMERLGAQAGLAIEDSDAGEASARAAGLDVLRIHAQSEMPARLRKKLAAIG